MSPGKIAVAAATFACTALLSVGWSEQHGVSLSIEHAQARVSQQHTSKHVAAAPHRVYRRTARGYGPNPVAAGAGLAAGAVNTAGAVAAGAVNTAGAVVGAATSPWYGSYAGPAPGYGAYYASSPWGDYECHVPSAYECKPYASRWSR